MLAAGIPLELLTGAVSALGAGFLTIWSKKIEHERERWANALNQARLQGDLAKEAREFKGTKSFQFTRRAIALMAVFAIIVLPKLAAIFRPDLGVNVGYTEWHPGFLFFTEGREATEWVTVQGLTLTPLDTHTVMAIVGMYFGASVVKNA
ncbi:MAG: hypothetical protein GY906_23240 [bacterium]|nr:hypothetical protein [bacterium]